MRLPILLIAGVITPLTLPLPALAESPRITVNFTEPEKFTDATYRNHYKSREQVTRDLAEYLTQLGERYLPAAYSLEIEVTDVDLAGRYEPWHFFHAHDVRFMREVTWPRINLSYRLLNDRGDTVLEREERVSDMSYLTRFRPRLGSDRLRYEKAMLENWFQDRFSEPAVASLP